MRSHQYLGFLGAFCLTLVSAGNASNKSLHHHSAVNWKNITNEEWAKRLTHAAYVCAREAGTEKAFTGEYLNNKAEGVYKCVCCGSDLFPSKTKFNSGSGWPSFYAPVTNHSLTERKDHGHGMMRTEVLCSTCDAHLGHVFDDGPEPTGLRYCINSVCLKFAPKSTASSLKIGYDVNILSLLLWFLIFLI